MPTNFLRNFLRTVTMMKSARKTPSPDKPEECIMKNQPKQSARKRRKLAQWRLHGFDASARAPVDSSKLNTGGSWFWRGNVVQENGVYYYTDFPFTCCDCGKACVWKAKDQKWWYEEMHGAIDTTAIRCRACRIKERERKAEARRVSEEGLARKRARQASAEPFVMKALMEDHLFITFQRSAGRFRRSAACLSLGICVVERVCGLPRRYAPRNDGVLPALPWRIPLLLNGHDNEPTARNNAPTPKTPSLRAKRGNPSAFVCAMLFPLVPPRLSLPRMAGEFRRPQDAPAGAREQPCSQSSILCGQC
jgi:hypothetical protein